MNTHIELVAELRKRNSDGRYDTLIENAQTMGYHDYKFDYDFWDRDYVEPKTKLVEDLRKFPELEDIAQQVMNGDYDEKPDEEDRMILFNDLNEHKGVLNDKYIVEHVEVEFMKKGFISCDYPGCQIQLQPNTIQCFINPNLIARKYCFAHLRIQAKKVGVTIQEHKQRK